MIKELAINIDNVEETANLFGNFDENIKLIEKGLDVKIVVRGGTIKITGEEKNVDSANKLFTKLMDMIKRGDVITTQNVLYTMNLIDEGEEEKLKELMSDIVCITARGKQIRCKTYGQLRYVEAIRKNQIVFGIGPAGTGKTYLAMAMAITALKNKEVGRIILTRPAVEAGEKLGFLPGDLQEKVDPYLRPLYDALYDILGAEVFQKYMEKGLIEVAPLAYMRGRTLDDSFIILDEAQNTTPEQMKMFLTRIGFGSKAVITGDVTQIDLPKGKKSGLKEVMEILRGIEGIEFVMLSEQDVIRHPLVAKIIKAYEEYEKRKEESDLEKERGE
ncbi:MAG: Phosphate starvation-inducible protein PhoH, predicted ATPase [Caldanaerobacter subterraneus]|uniref:PhoH-like protein n=1 Tax=Caldanaerobacter subterraneus TaxID=911092 RepID=A0A101E669_9THEO|nr:PhoH family protein [Caldanaerobacter subterraneus]MDK2794539.1 phosphate starvation-inducible protein PhoH [Caldanaerobacter sp.]KUK09244.1 MAG: Phosphate starvation-inducible protein PhoH, predicted ATPase [Caldanaerobacter subterraneus]MBE3579765.1 PhoH family protein [Caldanaerobacter subterraneus]TCO63906.1 phosphate starvation-inducible PhoH-like protein [Caldanaerobacter subterraneus]HBT50324.1 phosphate starvation-inducible protein PhoH [Caldanaerobacter subterraneus]